ncbi:MAG: cytochrome oxidase putative small subunit CydP [Steroidobacterales bacterium]
MSPLAWRHDLGRKLIWLVALKLVALAALWLLFFSPAHRPPVDSARAAEHLGAAR